MLYIASALASTAVSHSLLLERSNSEESETSLQLSLVLAKGNRVEVHDVGASGLTERCELDVWGQIVGLAKVPWEDAKDSHFLVLTDAPLARLMLLEYDSTASTPEIRTVSYLNLSPPSRSSRHAEFFTGLITCQEHNLVIASLWTGVLSVASVGYPAKKGGRKESVSTNTKPTIELRDSYNLNIKEHNLVSLSFVPSSSSLPMLAFLSLSSTRSQVVQLRSLTNAAQLLTDLCQPTTISMDACPAARHLIGLQSSLVVIGDEFTSFYDISQRSGSNRLGSSPEAVVKKRKGSVGGSVASAVAKQGADGGEMWDIKAGFRLRQGYGTILATEVITAGVDSGSLLLGDEFGKLSALSFSRNTAQALTSGAAGMSQLTTLGQTSPPTSLTYIDSGYVFVGSHCGDSQIIKIASDASVGPPAVAATSTHAMSSPESIRSSPRKGKGKARSSDSFDLPDVVELENGRERAEVTEALMNLAPVNDFCVVEEEGGGAAKIITASGASTSNSLRVVKSGVGLDTKLTVQGVADVQRMWPLSSGDVEDCDDLLLISTSTHTLLLSFTDNGRNVMQVTDGAYSDLITDKPTLAAGQLPEARGFVQVTSTKVVLVRAGTAGAYASKSEIVAAAINKGRLLIGERSNEVRMLRLPTLDELSASQTSEEPSAVAIGLRTDGGDVVAVATWNGQLSLHHADSLEVISASPQPNGDEDVDMDATLGSSSKSPSTAKLPSHAASLAFHAIKLSSERLRLQLLAGLGNGSLMTFDVNFAGDGCAQLGEAKATTLGPLPVQLTPARNTSSALEQNLVMAVSERLTLLFEDRDRLAHSSISRPDLTCAAAMRSPGLGSCLVMAAQQSLTFSSVTSLKKLHVQKMDLGDKSPMRIAYDAGGKYLGLGILQASLDASTGDMLELGYFELRDATSLESLAQYLLEPTESIIALETVVIQGVRFFAVGTAFDATEGSMNNVKRGRLLLLEPAFSFDDQTWGIKLQGELNVAGPVYAVQPVREYVAVASQNKVTIYKAMKGSTNSEIVFSETSTWGSAFVAEHLSLAPADEGSLETAATLLVGDSMRSVSTLHVNELGVIGNEKRDLSTHWVTGLHPVRDGGKAAIISDSNYNLMTLRLGEQVENAARFGLHEHLTRFRPGSVAPPAAIDSAVAKPDILFSTAAGRIGIISELGQASTRILDDLQRNLELRVKGPGDLDYSAYRRARLELGSKPSVGFVDGDFVQRYLSLSTAEQEQVLAGRSSHDTVSGADGKSVDRGEVLRILEAVGQMH